jgi:hypothetical protein
MASMQNGKVAVDTRNHAAEFATLALTCIGQSATRRTRAAFGPIVLDIEVCGSVLCSVALDALRHAAISTATAADLRLAMIDGRETNIDGQVLSDLVDGDGIPAGKNSARATLTANIHWRTYCLVEENKRRIIVWVADASAVPEWVIYDQIRNALHWASLGRSFGMFHAAALRLGHAGCLIAGKSGSGKSTITAAAVNSNFNSAGDDFVLVENATSPPRVHAVFDTIKLDQKGLERFPQFRHGVRNPTRGSKEKAIVHLFDSAPSKIATGFPLHALLHARLSGKRESRILKSSHSAAFRALAPSSLLLLRTQSKEASAKCATLAGELQPYAFEIGTDLDAAVAELTAFLRDRT